MIHEDFRIISYARKLDHFGVLPEHRECFRRGERVLRHEMFSTVEPLHMNLICCGTFVVRWIIRTIIHFTGEKPTISLQSIHLAIN